MKLKMAYGLWACRLFLPLMLLSCSESVDYAMPPDISIGLPLSGQSYGYGDSIHFQVELSHYKPIQYVKVSVTNTSNVPVLPALNFTVNTLTYTVSGSVPLNNTQMSGGTYYLQFKAGDGASEGSASVTINYSALERKLLSALAISRLSASEYSVSDYTMAGQLSERFRFSGDYSGASVSSLNQQLYTAGSITGNLNAWNLEENKADWVVPAIVDPPMPYFHHVYSDEQDVYVSDREGYIRGFASDGLVTFRSQPYPNGKFTGFVRVSNWLLAVFEPYNGVFSELVIFNYPGGTVYRQVQFQGKSVHLSPYGKEGIMLFVNEGQASAVYHFSVPENRMVRLRTFPFPVIGRVAGAADGNCFIASGGDLWWYRPGTGSLVKLLAFDRITALQYEPLSGLVFVSTGNSFGIFQLPAGEALRVVTLQSEITDLLLLYNR